jgi:hypothetical protein
MDIIKIVIEYGRADLELHCNEDYIFSDLIDNCSTSYAAPITWNFGLEFYTSLYSPSRPMRGNQAVLPTPQVRKSDILGAVNVLTV